MYAAASLCRLTERCRAEAFPCIEAHDRACLEKLLKGPATQGSPEYLALAAEGYALLGRQPQALAAIADALRGNPAITTC